MSPLVNPEATTRAWVRSLEDHWSFEYDTYR